MTEHPPPATPDDDQHATPPEELAQPVPITVWHVPGPPPDAVASAQLVRRLVVNYSPPRSPVLVLPGARPAQHPGSESVTLVVTSWPRPGVSAEEPLAGCARRLRPGGCLTVVVANADIPDQLGRLVTAARAGGLTYLQHIVAAHHLAPRPNEPVTDCGDRPHTARGARGERALRVHTDVLVFRQPALNDD